MELQYSVIWPLYRMVHGYGVVRFCGMGMQQCLVFVFGCMHVELFLWCVWLAWMDLFGEF